MMKDLARPNLLLAEANEYLPGFWRTLDAERTAHKGSWPDWCFIPITSVISCLPIDARDDWTWVKVKSVGSYLTALYTWRMTQGIYRIDPDVMEALGAMPPDGSIPNEVLYRLPEWCVYIDFSHTDKEQTDSGWIHGVFVHLEYCSVTQEAELRFLADTSTRCVAISIHLGCSNLAASLDRAMMLAKGDAQRLGYDSRLEDQEDYWQKIHQATGAWLNFVLYLTATNADYNGPAPARSEPIPVRTKKGPRYFPPNQPRVWDVGLREGAALRASKAKLSTGSSETGGSRAPMRPHIRRAHWHLYRVGPGRSGQALKWIAPTLVGGGTPEDRPAVIHHV